MCQNNYFLKLLHLNVIINKLYNLLKLQMYCKIYYTVLSSFLTILFIHSFICMQYFGKMYYMY